MSKSYSGSPEELRPILHNDNMRYGLSVGRRCPMHSAHVTCLRDIIAAGLTPVVCFGSANDATNPNYDPIKTPLTVEQQITQLRMVMEQEFPDLCETVMALAFAQEDVGNAEKWSASVVEKLKDGEDISEFCVMHFFDKNVDHNTPADASIKPLSNYSDAFLERGVSVWHCFTDSELSATIMREWDLRHLTDEQRATFAAPDYIISLAEAARANNPDRDLLEKIPVTMLDLSLERMRNEAGITTADVVSIAQKSGALSLKSIKETLGNKLKEHNAQHGVAPKWQDKAESSSPGHPLL